MRPPNSPDTITDETRDSHNTFDTKFWDSFDVMLSCVFCWSQYLRVLILSCLSCSIAVIMVVTSTQTDRQSIYGVCHKWLNGALHGLWGIAAHHKQHIRPHWNFMLSGVFDGWGIILWPHLFVFIHHHHQSWIMLSIKRNGKTAETVVSSIMIQWCLSSIILNHESMMCVFIHYESIINEWWIINRQSSIISPWLPFRNCGSLVLVARWRTVAFSQFCSLFALPYIKRAIASL